MSESGHMMRNIGLVGATGAFIFASIFVLQLGPFAKCTTTTSTSGTFFSYAGCTTPSNSSSTTTTTSTFTSSPSYGVNGTIGT